MGFPLYGRKGDTHALSLAAANSIGHRPNTASHDGVFGLGYRVEGGLVGVVRRAGNLAGIRVWHTDLLERRHHSASAISLTPKMTFRDYLNSEKERLDITQPALAAILGQSTRTICYWLSGERIPDNLTQIGVRQILSQQQPKTKNV